MRLFMAWKGLRLLELDACAWLLRSRGLSPELAGFATQNGAAPFDGIGLPSHGSEMVVKGQEEKLDAHKFVTRVV